MASVVKRPQGHFWIQFWDFQRKRQTIRLGKTSRKKAERLKTIVEDCLSSIRLSQVLEDKTQEWLNEADDVIYSKLAAVGLVNDRDSFRLEPFIDEYIKSRTDLKPRTVVKFNATKEYLVEHFGANRELRRINEADGEAFRIFLLSKKNHSGKPMAENTVRKHTQIAKQFFNHAIKRDILRVNPLAELPSTVMPNKERMFYINHQQARAVIDACPDAQWRLIFALARYGALRCPSEILRLRWEDINWEKQEMFVRSEKTEHHVGQGRRKVPIYTDLFPFLKEAYDQSEGMGEYVIHRYRAYDVNLRSELHCIIDRAGVERWPKAFQNLRASRATDLVMHHPMHVVSQWTGHSIETMRKFYLQVTEEHREAALKIEPQLPPSSTENTDPVLVGEAKSKARQTCRDGSRQPAQKTSQTPVFAGFGFDCLGLSDPEVAAEGLEPPTRGL